MKCNTKDYDVTDDNFDDDFVLFADDTNIFVVGKDEDKVYENAQVLLNKVNDYMNSNQLHINLKNQFISTFVLF